MDRDSQDLYELMKTKMHVLTLSQLVSLVAQVFSPATTDLVLALLEAVRRNPARSRRFLARAEADCVDEAELCYVLHVEAMTLTYLGDLHEAIERETRALDLCDRLGYKELQADVLSHVSMAYEALGHKHLAAAYAAEAARMMS